MKKILFFLGLIVLLFARAFSQEKNNHHTERSSDPVLIGNSVSLTQFGNQNTANLSQFGSFGQEIFMHQSGSSHLSTILFSGSGTIQMEQKGSGHQFIGQLEGENKYLELIQRGSDHEITLWSVGDNSSHRFLQSGNYNSIEYLNQTGNDTGIIIQQRGNNMNISVRSN